MAVSKPPRTTEVLLNSRGRTVRPCLDLVDLLNNGLLKGWKRSFALVVKPRHSISAPVGIKVVYSPPPIKCDCSFINHFRVSPWYNILINELFEAAAWNGRLVSGFGPPSLIELKICPQIKLHIFSVSPELLHHREYSLYIVEHCWYFHYEYCY